MTAIAHDGVVQFYWVPTIADIDAPKVSEITAGDRIDGITNYTLPSNENEVDTSDMDSLYDTSVVGTTKAGPIELTMKRDDTDESAGFGLFTLRDTGYLVRLPFGGGGALGVPAASDVAEVYPAQVGQPRPEGYGRNTTQKFMISMYVTSAPSMSAAVAT